MSEKEPLRLVGHDLATPKLCLEQYAALVEELNLTSLIIVGIGPGGVIHAQGANVHFDPLRLLGAMDVARTDLLLSLMEGE